MDQLLQQIVPTASDGATMTASNGQFNWQFARYLTTGCNDIVHLNNAGAALMPNCVLDAAITHLKDEARYGAYEAAERAQSAIDHVYESSARLLRCTPAEIAVVENASRAWSLAFGSIKFDDTDIIVTTTYEYANNYIAILQARRRHGVRVIVLPNVEAGEVSLDGLKGAIGDFGQRIRVISITHVPTHNGVINPALEIGQIIRDAKSSGLLSSRAIYILDACQSVGQLDVDVRQIGADILTTCSRKYLRGPRGMGLLFVRHSLIDPRDTEEPLLLDVRAANWTTRDSYSVYTDGRRFETWDTNQAGKIALGVAIDHACTWGLSNIEAYNRQLAETLRSRLREIRHVRVHDVGTRRCGIVSFSVNACDAVQLREFLKAHRINIGISERALTRMDMEDRQLETVLRASVHYYNSEQEIEMLAQRVEDFCRAQA